MAKKLWHNLLRSGKKKYYIRGTSTAATVTVVIRDQSYSVDVINGVFEIEYDTPLVGALSIFGQNTTITSLDFSMSCGLRGITNGAFAFQEFTNLASIDFTNCDFSNVVSFGYAFRGCSALQSVEMHGFASCVETTSMFSSCSSLASIVLDKVIPATSASGMFAGTKIESIDIELPNATDILGMFGNCSLLRNVTLKVNNHITTVNKGMVGLFMGLGELRSVTIESTFEDASLAVQMFSDCAKLELVSMPYATFDAATNCSAMFINCRAIRKISLPNATFANATTQLLWSGAGMFTNCNSLVELELPSANFAKMTNTQSLFSGCTSLTTISVPQNATAILPTSTAANAPMDLRNSLLTYQSMLNVANWVSDMSGQSAHTITFKNSAWNALTAAEQAQINGILYDKNWSLATA